MKHHESPQSLAVLKLINNTSECTFDLTLDGPRLRSIFFGFRSSRPFEEYYQYFVGVANTYRTKKFTDFATVL